MARQISSYMQQTLLTRLGVFLTELSFLLPDCYPIFNTSSIIGTSSILYHLGWDCELFQKLIFLHTMSIT